MTSPASRIFLTVVGTAYLALALWCLAAPAATARSVGFELRPGSGQSEYLVVYGGLQLGLAWLFLQPLWRPALTCSMLEACGIVHGCIVAVRTVSFCIYSSIESTTCVLAAIEWAIFLCAAALLWRESRRSTGRQT